MGKEVLDLLKGLFSLDELHEEFTSDDFSYVVDTQREGDTLTIKVTLKENEDKKEFENWVSNLDDDLFREVWESLSEKHGLKELNDLYGSDSYKEVINLFKDESKKLLDEKLDKLTSLKKYLD